MKVLLIISMLINWPPAELTDYEQMVLSMGLIVYQDGTTSHRYDDYWTLYNDDQHIENLTKELNKEEKKVRWLESEIIALSGQTNQDAVNTRNLMLLDQGKSDMRSTTIRLNIRYFEMIKLSSWPN